ncbi:MAG TPA: hypothetical protein VHR86_01210 [Armatimonadota bacterium]|nr:hypothetical protein [Armatimonadota bacterium]
MRVLKIALLACIVCTGLSQPAAARDNGSFLAKPVASLSEFLARVRSDAALQKRYGVHLGRPRAQIPALFTAKLRAERLRAAGFYTVYNITAAGEIYPTKQRLPAGTIFYRLQGSPYCFTRQGNPVRRFSPPVVMKRGPDPAALPAETLSLVHVPSE